MTIINDGKDCKYIKYAYITYYILEVKYFIEIDTYTCYVLELIQGFNKTSTVENRLNINGK